MYLRTYITVHLVIVNNYFNQAPLFFIATTNHQYICTLILLRWAVRLIGATTGITYLLLMQDSSPKLRFRDILSLRHDNSTHKFRFTALSKFEFH